MPDALKMHAKGIPDLQNLTTIEKYREVTGKTNMHDLSTNSSDSAVTHFHLSCTDIELQALSANFVCTGKPIPTEQFFEYVYDNESLTLLKNGHWLFQRIFKDGTMEYTLKKTEKSDFETVAYSVYDPTVIPQFNLKDYSFKFYWFITQCTAFTTCLMHLKCMLKEFLIFKT